MKNRLHVLSVEGRWSQAELAQHLGVSRQAMNAIEAGKYTPSLNGIQNSYLFNQQIEGIFEPNQEE